METDFFDGGLYKIFTKVLANRLQKYLPKLIHPAQYGFIAGRNILHNVLNLQMAMDYARNTHQELIMVQLYLEKAYDNVNWSIVSTLMHTVGFGPRMSRLIFLLGQDVVSRVMGELHHILPSQDPFIKGALLAHCCLLLLLIPC